MKTIKNRIGLVALILLVGLVMGCSDADLAVPENNNHLNVEGSYEGPLAGDMGFGDSVGQITYNC